MNVAAAQPEPVAPGSKATLFRIPPHAVFRKLARWGRLRLVVGNAAVRVERAGALDQLESDGQRVRLGGDAELWLFPEQWREAVTVVEPALPGDAVAFRFFHASGARVLEVLVDANTGSAGGPSLRATLARWRAGGFAAIDDRRADGPRPPRPATIRPGTQIELARARKHGDVGAVRALALRYGLSRIETLALLGDPWAHRVLPFAVRTLLEQISKRRLGVQLLVGNEGLTFVRGGPLPSVHCEGRNAILREADLTIKIRESFVESLWAVRLRDADHDVSSLEGYDLDGNPALLLLGVPDRSNGESPAWRAFVESRRLRGERRRGAAVRGAPNRRAATGGDGHGPEI